MKIFLTGGTGFVGCHFINQAHTAGHSITALRRPGSQLRFPLEREPAWVTGTLADSWQQHLSGNEVLVHLAAAGVNTPQTWDWKELFAVNVDQSVKLWLDALDAGIKRFVICGSCFEYGRAAERYDFVPVDAPLEPTGSYHASKAAATAAAVALAVEKNLELALLRPFQVFGEGEAMTRFWPSLRKAAQSGADYPMTPGEQVRDFVPVEQVAAAFVEAITRNDLRPGQPKIENIGTGKPQSVRAFAEHWWRTWRASGKLQPGALPYRGQEVMRYVPEVPKRNR